MNDRFASAAPLPMLLADSVKTALDAGVKLAEKKILTSPSAAHPAPYVVLRDKDGAETLVSLERVYSAPDGKRGVFTFHDARSFGAYWMKHRDEGSAVYATVPPHGDVLSFTSVIDEHQTAAPRWREHRATYTPRMSVEWDLWRSKNKHKFEGNVAFAEWLEDAYFDIVKPSGADMLQIALTMRVDKAMAFSNPSRLADGHTEFQFNEIVSGSAVSEKGGKVKIPNTIEIEIPLFAGIGQPKYRMEARFKYRLGQSGLSIWYELVRPHRQIEQASKDLIAAVEKETGVKVLFGTA